MDQYANNGMSSDRTIEYGAFVLETFDAAPFEFDLASDVLYPSPRLKALFRIPPNYPLTFRECRSRFHHDDRMILQRSLEAARLAGQQRFECEFRIVLPGGEYRWVIVHAAITERDASEPYIHGIVIDCTERKRIEQQAREREARLQLALDAAELGTWTWDLLTGAGTLDERSAAITGLPVGNVADVGAMQRLCIHPDDIDRLYQEIPAGIASGSSFSLTYRVIHHDGSVRYVDSRARVLADAAGQPVQLVGTDRDITADYVAQRVLAESEAKYRALFDSIDEGFCIIEVLFNENQYPHDYSFLEVNPSFEKQTGIKQAVGRTMRSIAANHEDYWFESYGHIALSGEPRRFENAAKALGFEYDVYAWRIGSPELHHVAVLFSDITERKRVEATLRASASRQAFLLLLNDRLRSLVDPEEIQYEAARTLGEYLGVSRAGYAEALLDGETLVVNRHYANNVPSIEGLYKVNDYGPELWVQFQAGNTVVYSNRTDEPLLPRHGKNATLQPASMIDVPLVKAGRLVALLFVHCMEPHSWSQEEVTLAEETAERTWAAIERARAETALRESEERFQQLYTQERAARAQAEEASQLKDEFLATVSHELRTPLTAFLGYAELLNRRVRDEAYVRRTVGKMVQSARSQAALIEDLLDVSRIVSGKLRIEPEPIDLVGVVHQALDTVRPVVEAKALQLHVDLGTRASMLIGDANRLQQVVWNLLSNATKFTPSGGDIVVQLVQEDHWAVLTVRDSGEGIRPEFLPHVFERFRQADSTSQRMYGGLGLGLAIVRHLVELHAGTVEATSTGLHQGATFTVRLPLAGTYDSSLAPAQTEEWVQKLLPLQSFRVLVVDDQAAIAEMVGEILATDGAVVRVCTNAREALEVVRSWQPAVLISDIAMPGEDGYWLIEQIHQLAPEQGGDTPAVALTAYVRMEDRLKVLRAGFQRYIPKPIDASELRDVIVQLVSSEAE